MLFRYQVLDKQKQLFRGEVEADDLRRARLALMHQGFEVLQIDPVKQKSELLKRRMSGLGVVSLKEKMLFVKHLSLMIKSGLVLDDALSSLKDQARGRMKAILRRLLLVVRKGNLLSDGLAMFGYTFSDFFVNMVRVGERSGTLEQNLGNLSVKLRKDHELTSKVRNALMYPAIVVIALVGLGFTLSVIVLPKLLGFFKKLDIEIPLTTRIFIASAEFLQSHWLITLVAMVAAVVTVVLLNKLKPTKIVIHWVVLHLPIFRRFSRTSNCANFCRSMNLLLVSGITIDDALHIMSGAVNNVLYRRAVIGMLTQVKQGESLATALTPHHAYFPEIITKMVHVGEVSGNLSETFSYLAEFYEDEMDYLSKNLSTLIEPALLVIIGVIVGFIAMAIISPIYQLTGGIRA